MVIDETYISCGVDQLFDLQHLTKRNIKSEMVNIIQDYIDPYENEALKSPAFLIFSDVVNRKGEFLYNYIKKNDLGNIVKSASAINQNSKNRIVVYLWRVNWKNLKRHVRM